MSYINYFFVHKKSKHIFSLTFRCIFCFFEKHSGFSFRKSYQTEIKRKKIKTQLGSDLKTLKLPAKQTADFGLVKQMWGYITRNYSVFSCLSKKVFF